MSYQSPFTSLPRYAPSELTNIRNRSPYERIDNTPVKCYDCNKETKEEKIASISRDGEDLLVCTKCAE